MSRQNVWSKKRLNSSRFCWANYWAEQIYTSSKMIFSKRTIIFNIKCFLVLKFNQLTLNSLNEY